MKDNKYIFCSIKFKKSGKSYYYLTQDETLEVGDYVEVQGLYFPTVVIIEKIEKFTQENVPFDVTRMKSITKLIKKHNAPVSREKSLYGEFATEEATEENADINEIFKCLDTITCEVQNVLSEEQILYFEENNNVKLPIQYREMLLKEGNGIRIHYKTAENGVFKGDTHYRDIYGINWKKKSRNDRLSRPFNFGNKTEVSIEDLPFPQFRDCMQHTISDAERICNICDHKNECVHSLAGVFKDTAFYNGTLEILYAGCTYSYHLILNGPKRGEVWYSDENTFFIRYAKSFKEFLEKMCTEECI